MAELNEIVGSIPEKKEKKQSAADIETEIAALTLQEKKLALLEREANLQDVKERLEERQLKRDNTRQKAIANGQTIKLNNADLTARQKRCNHRKGGNGAHGVVGGQGDDQQYAVWKHTFANGDKWVGCLRCRRTWKPVRRDDYKTEAEYSKVMQEYQAALDFPTRNVSSGAVVYQFSDQGDFYRQTTKDFA